MVNERNLNPSGREEKLSEKNIARLKKLAGVMAIASLSLTGCNSVEAKHEQTPEQSYSIEESEPTDDYDLDSNYTDYIDEDDYPLTEGDKLYDYDTEISDILTRKPKTAKVKKIEAMDHRDFRRADIQTQYIYTSYINQYRDDFMKAVHYSTLKDDFEANAPMRVTPESTAEELFRDQEWQVRLAAYATKEEPSLDSEMGCGVLDTSAVNKLMSSSTRADNFGHNYVTNLILERKDRIYGLTPGYMNGLAPYMDLYSVCPTELTSPHDDERDFYNAFKLDTQTVLKEVRKQEVFEGIPSTAVTVEYTDDKHPEAGRLRTTIHIVPVENWEGEQEYTTVMDEVTILDQQE